MKLKNCKYCNKCKEFDKDFLACINSGVYYIYGDEPRNCELYLKFEKGQEQKE